MNLFENKKKKLLKQKIEAKRLEAHNNGKFSLFDTKIFTDIISKDSSYEQLNNYYETILEYEKKSNLPFETGVTLEKLSNDNTVMIHRTRLNLDTDNAGLTCNESLYDIMNNGLMNQGHSNAAGGGVFSSTPPSLTLTMTPLTGLAGYINLLSSYHSNDAIIIAAFPKELVDSKGNFIDNSSIDKVYDLSGNFPRVRKEFMVGTILKKNNNLDEFYTRDEIINSFDNNKASNMNF